MNQIRITHRTQRIEVNPATSTTKVINAGPIGPPGIPGPPGSNGAAIAFEHTQVTPSSSWVINHNLGFKPNYNVQEAITGISLMCSEIHHTVNQLELQFNTPRAGVARLS